MIALEQLAATREGFALGPLDLRIETGEYFVLLGPSGSGKTTLLETLAGFVPAGSGNITIEGRAATRLPPHERALGIVYQDSSLFPHLSVRGNLEYPCRVRGVDARETQRRVSEAAARLRIEELLDEPASRISGGETRRVALGRALAAGCRVLLLDEPLGALDPPLRRELRLQLAALQRELSLTILHITHELEEARALAGRIGVIDRGKLLQCGTLEDLGRAPANVQVARSLGLENFVSGPVQCGGLLCEGAALPAPPGAADHARAFVRGLRLGVHGTPGTFIGMEQTLAGRQALVRIGGLTLHTDPPSGDPPAWGAQVLVDFSGARWRFIEQ